MWICYLYRLLNSAVIGAESVRGVFCSVIHHLSMGVKVNNLSWAHCFGFIKTVKLYLFPA